MRHSREQVGGIIHTHNDGGWADAKRAEEGASDVRGLWARDGGGITGFPPHDTAREGKGERVGMDGRSHGEGRAKDLSDGVSEGRGKGLPS